MELIISNKNMQKLFEGMTEEEQIHLLELLLNSNTGTLFARKELEDEIKAIESRIFEKLILVGE